MPKKEKKPITSEVSTADSEAGLKVFDLEGLNPASEETMKVLNGIVGQLAMLDPEPRLSHSHENGDAVENLADYDCAVQDSRCFRLGSYSLDYPSTALQSREFLFHFAQTNDAMKKEMPNGFSVLVISITPEDGGPGIHYIEFADGRKELEIEDDLPKVKREVLAPSEVSSAVGQITVGVRGKPEFMRSFTEGLIEHQEKRKRGMLDPTEAGMKKLIEAVQKYKSLIEKERKV